MTKEEIAMQKVTLGVIGTGNMASAIVGGILRQGLLAAGDMGFFDLDREKVQKFARQGAVAFENAPQVVENSRYVLLSVKPQNYPDVLREIAPACREDTVFISIAAGMTSSYIKSQLGYDARVVIVMPNTPLLVGAGAVALSQSAPVSAEEFAFVRSIFDAAGHTEVIPEEKMNEVIPLNGSSPAYIYYFAQVFVERAVQQGFDREVANRLFCSTLVGAAKMMTETGLSHQQLIDMVCSPNGTTIKGLDVMKEHHLKEAVEAGIDACIARAYELGH